MPKLCAFVKLAEELPTRGKMFARVTHASFVKHSIAGANQQSTSVWPTWMICRHRTGDVFRPFEPLAILMTPIASKYSQNLRKCTVPGEYICS
jgi:hypothetical protein